MSTQTPTKLGRYEIVRELGKGAMGVVYEGKDPNIGRRVAIKTARRDVLAASGKADELMERFLREARSAGGLNHPNIITIYDADEQDGLAYIAMEFLEGGDLEHYIQANRNIPLEKTIDICATIASALGTAHKQGIVHRDIKPANVIMTPDGIKLADFGIAHMSDSSLTQEGQMIGTPHYMSPEQFQGRKIDGRSDLWAVGVILYEMITGERPFTGEALSTVMTGVIKIDPIPPKELNIEVDDVLDAVVMKALNKNPSKRYQTGEEMAAALRETLKENPDPAITKVGGAAIEKMVVGGGDATIITGADATVLTGAAEAPAQQTVRAEKLPSSEAAQTVPGGVPGAPAVQERAGAVVPGKKSKTPIYIGGGIGAVVLTVIIAVVAMMGGGEKPAGNGGTASGGGIPANASFQRVSVKNALIFWNKMDYGLWGEDWENPPDSSIAEVARGASVKVIDNETGATIASNAILDDGTAEITLPEGAKDLTVVVSATRNVDGVERRFVAQSFEKADSVNDILEIRAGLIPED